jgi:glycine/D-amino acid oxidase-like deaminating enzyme
MHSRMTTRPHILVVGAGIVGASIAWHLTSAGARVTVVDVGAGGGIATPRSFAWINASWGNPEPYFRLRIRAMTEWRRLAAAVPGMQLAWTGGLCWDLPPPQLEAYAIEHGGWGYGIRRVDRAEAMRLEPNLLEPPAFALHVAEEGAVEPRAAADALLADAERRGAIIRLHTPVNRIVRKDGAVVGVETAAGRLEADEVVLAAGAATVVIAMTASIGFPLEAPSGLLVHSHPHSRLLNGLVLAPELHMRQTAEGRIVIGADFGGGDPGADAGATARVLFAKARSMLRGSDTLALDFHSVGYRPMPADGFPVIGRPQGLAGLYLAVMHSGITLAPAVGLFATDEILNGRRDPLLAPYAPSRFAGARFAH